MVEIIKGSLGLFIPEEWSVLLQEMHITMRFLSELANEMAEKF